MTDFPNRAFSNGINQTSKSCSGVLVSVAIYFPVDSVSEMGVFHAVETIECCRCEMSVSSHLTCALRKLETMKSWTPQLSTVSNQIPQPG